MLRTAFKHPNGARLLALDGGGVRGISALAVLDEIMKRVQTKLKLKEPGRPSDYFDLAGGTSTGGIIGIMLFRLHMTTDDAIKSYYKIAKEIFSPKVFGHDVGWLGSTVRSFVNNSRTVARSCRFDDVALRSAIDDVVAKYGLDENDKRMKGDAPLYHSRAGKVFLCTTAQNRAETVLMRSYKNDHQYHSSIVNDAMKNSHDEISISLATRATSAAPTYFPEVRWRNNGRKLIFWDGGLLNNNPIDQLWYSRYDLVSPEHEPPDISSVISLGTGYIRPGAPSDSWLKLAGVASSVMDFATNTNAKGKDFSRHMWDLRRRKEHENSYYVRFNPPLGENPIGLEDYTKMEELEQKAREYFNHPSGEEFIEKAVDSIAC